MEAKRLESGQVAPLFDVAVWGVTELDLKVIVAKEFGFHFSDTPPVRYATYE